jgi:hypothetical protein
VREDAAARRTPHKGQTIVMTPIGRWCPPPAVSCRCPRLTRRNNRWLVPLEFISRALAPIYDVLAIFVRPRACLVLGDLRVPRVTARSNDSPSLLRVTLETTPRATATVTEAGPVAGAVDADALDAALPSPPPQQLLTGIRVVDPNTIQLDLGPRFSTFRASPPVSSGAAALVTIELVGAGVDTSSNASASAPGGATADKPVAPGAPGDLPVFGSAARPTSAPS